MKKILDGSRLLPIAAALFALTVAIPFLTQKPEATGSYAFEITLHAAKAGVVQLYYDIGRDFNEGDSASLPLTAGAEKVYRFPLPFADYRGLRFDPNTTDGTVTLSSARIVSGSGRVLRTFPPDQFLPTQQIASAALEGNKLRIEIMPGSSDPITHIDGVAPFSLRQSWGYRLPALLIWSLGGAAFIWLIGRAATAAWTSSALAWARRRPRQAIILAATAGIAWQMHPVIFAGRSLVSPDNGPVVMLHEGAQTLPGYRSQPNNPHNSDVGAMMWHHVPFSIVEHSAVFRDHLWPLWNRYNRCGIPLLGQGQSMFGDPLHWITIAANGASWAWDMKFVIARWLFACGLGLAAWQLEAGLAGALLTALTSAFIGFFAFRYNHAAAISVCYSPLILVAGGGLSRCGSSRRALWGCLALLITASLMTMNSGTIKEAYMLIVGLHLAGVLVLLSSAQPWIDRLRKLGAAAAALGIFALLSAPLWLSFLVTLGRSVTLAYDTPRASQIPLGLLIGFFDDLFYRQLQPAEVHWNPSVNFLALLGLGWSLVRWRISLRNPAWRAVVLSASIPFGFVFGLVPASVIVKIPFVANIISIDNAFSCVLIVHVLVLAAFGWSQLLRDLGQPGWGRHAWRFLLGLAVLLALYFNSAKDHPKSGFFSGYAITLIIAVAAFPWLAARARAAGRTGAAAAAIAACVVLTLWRHGEYRHSPFDFYTVNPGQRADLRPPSPALDFVRQHAVEPARTLGLGQNFFPGYGELSEIETIYGVDPLESRAYYELARAFGLDHVWDWTGQDLESDVPSRLHARNMLNNRFYLATPNGPPRALPGLRLLERLDFDVYESPNAWPRAFFTDAVLPYDTPAQFAEAVQSGDGRPFAAVLRSTLAKLDSPRRLPPVTPSRAIIPARDYALDTNTTAFTVDATGPGVIVLSETYYHNDFEVLLDGHPARYFRANHAFKGIAVDSAGTHRVSFSYWPEHFTLALAMSLAGLGLFLGATVWMLFVRDRDHLPAERAVH